MWAIQVYRLQSQQLTVLNTCWLKRVKFSISFSQFQLFLSLSFWLRKQKRKIANNEGKATIKIKITIQWEYTIYIGVYTLVSATQIVRIIQICSHTLTSIYFTYTYIYTNNSSTSRVFFRQCESKIIVGPCCFVDIPQKKGGKSGGGRGNPTIHNTIEIHSK